MRGLDPLRMEKKI